MLMATLSTMVIFALERANLDILLFMMALTTGFLAGGGLAARLVGYAVAVLAALLKYYPITMLIIVFRERVTVFFCIVLIAVGIFSAFWVGYHDEIAKGLPLIPGGRYDTDLFAAKNLPFLVGLVAESAAEPSNFAALLGRITTVCLYAALLTLCLALSRRLMRARELPAALTSLPRLEQVFLVIGSAVITGCFFAFRFPDSMQKEFSGMDRFLPITYRETWKVVREIAEASGTSYTKAAHEAESQREAEARAANRRQEAPSRP